MPLGAKNPVMNESRFSGVEISFCPDLDGALQLALQGGFDYILYPLGHPRNRRTAPSARSPTAPPPLPWARSDLLLSSSQWGGQVVGKASPWIRPDASCLPLRRDSEAALKQELAWAAHLGLQAVVLPTPDGLDSGNYARVANHQLMSLSHMQLWLRIPLLDPEVDAAESGVGSDPLAEGGEGGGGEGGAANLAAQRHAHLTRPTKDPWEWWDAFRSQCEHHSLLGVCLDLSANLPPAEHLARWKGEPVKAVIIPTSAFLTNKRGYPCLSKPHQRFVTDLMKHNVQVIVRGKPRHDPAPTPSEAGGAAPPRERNPHPLHAYWEYVSYLFRRMEAPSQQETFEVSYRDYLQAPLQPLMDNLESQTYETFEKDTTKYSTYEEAVYRCLMDRVPEADKAARTTVLMVVGAGRGPLVRASLKAGERSGRKLKVYAVEKNPNAVITLQSLVVSEGWGDRVTVVPSDMRRWDYTEKADILVSELLGSFGDNELSPECLDGAQRFLRDDGVSIPQDYVSYLAPITSSKLYNEVKAYNDLQHFETAYVVKLHSVAPMAPAQAVFKFEHPNRDDPIDNSRYTKMVFEVPADAPSATLHGFAGYFDSKLYKDVHLSIYPPTHTPEMFSWFPIYFPIRTPMYVASGSSVVVHMWRCATSAKVWYEWSVGAGNVVSPVHNPGGRSYWVGL